MVAKSRRLSRKNRPKTVTCSRDEETDRETDRWSRVAAVAPPTSHNSIHNQLTAVEFVRPVPAVVASVALIHGRHTPARVVTLELIRATRYTHMRLSYVY